MPRSPLRVKSEALQGLVCNEMEKLSVLQNNGMKRQWDRREREGKKAGIKGKGEKFKIFLEKLVGSRVLKAFNSM